MRQLIHICLLFSVLSAYAQSKDSTKRDTVMIHPKIPFSINAFDIHDYLPQVTPKSPSVAALFRGRDISVNLNNGLASIEIPIYEIQAGSIKIPISLVYHHGGNKVSDMASPVGLGWSLQAIQSVNRNIRGRPDEDSGNGGLLGQSLYNLDPYLTSVSCLTENLKTDLDLFANWGNDIERDIFTIESLSNQNTFVLDTNGVYWQTPDKSKLSYTTGLQSFSLTDQQGIRYHYAVPENSDGYAATWHISEIQGLKPTEKIVYQYEDGGDVSYMAELTDYEVYQTDIGGLNSSGISGGKISGTYTTNIPTVHPQHISDIIFPNGKVHFTYTPNRADGLGKALSSIEVFGYNIATNTYSLIQKYALVQSYRDSRLFLDGVDLIGAYGTKIGSYGCEYNSTALPTVMSRSKDLHGYYNGKINSTLIPAQTFEAYERTNSGVLNTYQVGGADRSSDEFYMQARILTKLTYPTGGNHSFEYEAHRHDGGILAGGLRIKKIISNDANGKVSTKTYKYGVNESGDGTYRTVSPSTYATQQTFNHPRNGSYSDSTDAGKEYYYTTRVFSSAFIIPQNPSEGSSVTYQFVTEYTGVGRGKTTYFFDEGNGDDWVSLPSVAKSFLRSRTWTRGKLYNKAVYGEDGKKKYEVYNTYLALSSGISRPLGYLINKTNIQLNFYTVDNQGCIYNYATYTPIRQLYWDYGLKKLVHVNELFYDDTADYRVLFKQKDLSYDSQYYHIKEECFVQSDENIRIHQYKYVTDFDTHNPSLSNVNSPLYWLKQNNQLHEVIEKTEWLKMPSETESRLVGGVIKDYTEVANNNHHYVYPKEVYFMEQTPYPIAYASGYTASSLNVGILQKDSRYVKRLQLDSYDTNGNLLSYKMVGGVSNAYTYQTTPYNGSFIVYPSSETKNAGGTSPFTTYYAYTIPLLGVREITAPNGLKSSFDFDDFGRLQRIKDHEANILQEYWYSFATATASPFSLVNNFVKTCTPLQPLTSLIGNYNYPISTSYFDGLGRDLQTVQFKANPAATKDIVSNAKEYDNFGLVAKSYIPFSNAGNGAIAPLPSSIDNDSIPYSRVSLYDNSPLNRPKNTFGVGQAWKAANKFVENRYLIEFQNISKYQVSDTGVSQNGTLYSYFKNVRLPEQGNEVIEYKDNDGRLIQTSVQDGVGTYMSNKYFYDYRGDLSYVIQPFVYTGAFLESDAVFESVFAYHYDKRHRVIESHVPAGGWTYHVFDNLDREVMSQSQEQRLANKWSFVKYDAQGREILKGELTNTHTRQELQTAFESVVNAYEDGSTNQSYPSIVSVGVNDVREQRIYDNYTFIAPQWAFNSSQAYHARYADAKGLLTGIKVQDPQDPTKYYYTVLYYDSKNRVIQSFQTHPKGGTLVADKPIITNFQYNFTGDVTASKIVYQIDGQSNLSILTNQEYDHVRRLLKVYHGINGISPVEILRMTYDEIGKLSQKKILPNGSFTYGGIKDYIMRPSPDGVVYQSNSQDIARKAVVLQPTTDIKALTFNSYLAKIDSNASKGTTIVGLQTIDYTWHIRGALRGINLDASLAVAPKSSEADLFSYKLDYESSGQWAGNIGLQTWANSPLTPGGGITMRAYALSYDIATRLKTADFWGSGTENFSIPLINYDRNGNITKLMRYGKVGAAYGLVDNLTYTYANYGNRLVQITDTKTTNNGNEFVQRGGAAYTYYADGSLKSDDNEGISLITYDTYLKQPTQVTLSDGRWFRNYYDGSGFLFKTIYYSAANAVLETWEYMPNGLVFKNGQPYQIASPEGRAIYTPLGGAGGGVWTYEFDYKDHLGNTRVSFKADNGQLIQTAKSDFEPFGLKLANSVANTVQNRWEMQGKSSELTFGLHRIDLGARTMNPLTGIEDRIDPLAELDFNLSPYSYAGNNPVNSTDLFGLRRRKINDDTFEETTPFDEVTVKGSYNHAGNMFGFDSYYRYIEHNAENPAYRKVHDSFTSGGAIAGGIVVGVPAAIAAIGTIALAASADGAILGASRVTSLRKLGMARNIVRKYFWSGFNPKLAGSKLALSLTSQYVGAKANGGNMGLGNIDVVDVLADQFLTPFAGAAMSAEFNITYNDNLSTGSTQNIVQGVNTDVVVNTTTGWLSNRAEGLIDNTILRSNLSFVGTNISNYAVQIYQKIITSVASPTISNEIKK